MISGDHRMCLFCLFFSVLDNRLNNNEALDGLRLILQRNTQAGLKRIILVEPKNDLDVFETFFGLACA